MNEMVEILQASPFLWRRPDGKMVPRTRVTWRDAKGELRTRILEGTLRDPREIERKVKLIR